jgi:class 3 adenylate cyclase
VVTEAEAGPFVKGNFDYVYSVIQDAWRRLLNEDLLSQTVAEIDAAVEAFAEAVDKYPGITAKLAASLGIQGAPDKKSEAADE